MYFINSCLLAILLCISSFASAKGGYLYDYAGDVSVSIAGGAPHGVIASFPLSEQMVISTGNASRAVLKFEDGQLIVLRSNTTFRVQRYNFDTTQPEKSNILFSLLKGGLRAVTGLIGKQHKQNFKLTTPTATIGIRGTDFMLHTEGDGLAGQVTSGGIEMETDAGKSVFSAGQSAYTSSRGNIPSIAKLPPTTFLQLQVITTPSATPGAVPAPGTQPTPPSAQELTNIAKSIRTPGLTPSDIAKAMMDVGNDPENVTTGMIRFSPQKAAEITATVIKAHPKQAVLITKTAVLAAPEESAAISKAAIEAAPSQASDIINAVVTSLPSKSEAQPQSAPPPKQDIGTPQTSPTSGGGSVPPPTPPSNGGNSSSRN